jgi:hypothetical protein
MPPVRGVPVGVKDQRLLMSRDRCLLEIFEFQTLSSSCTVRTILLWLEVSMRLSCDPATALSGPTRGHLLSRQHPGQARLQ